MVTMGLAWLKAVCPLAAAVAFSLAGIAIYRLYLHPLAKFPGPRLWAISRIPYAYNLATGALPHRILEIHEKYGPTVRLAPCEISFTNEEAWAGIYGKPLGMAQLQKDQCQMYLAPNMAKSLLTEPSDASHGRMRRNFAHAFSEKTLRDSEPILQKYSDKLIIRLRENVGKPINMVSWYEFTLFDTIGDLLFGQSFGCLENSALHFWVALLPLWLKSATFLGMAERFFPPLVTVALWLLPKHLAESEIKHRDMTIEMLDARMKNSAPRPDFLSRVLEFADTPTGMNYSEIMESTKVLMVGGAETSSSVLSGITDLLLRNPSTMAKLVHEIRSTFKSEAEINMTSIKGLEYTLAVIHEGLRMFPPLPGSMRRLVPDGGREISGHYIPAGTLVVVDTYSAGRYSENYARSTEFCPERYLGTHPEFSGDKLKSIRPFSYGPRDCIGKNLAFAEMRMILARVFFNFDMDLVETNSGWMAGMQSYTFWQKPPLLVRLTPASVKEPSPVSKRTGGSLE